MDAAVRVREMNEAREKIGGEPFLSGDDAIKEAFNFGLCQELVLNENYDERLQSLKDAKRERERIAAEQRAEARHQNLASPARPASGPSPAPPPREREPHEPPPPVPRPLQPSPWAQLLAAQAVRQRCQQPKVVNDMRKLR